MTTKPDWSLSDYFIDSRHRDETTKQQDRSLLVIASLLIVATIAIGSVFFTLVKGNSTPSEKAAAPASIAEPSAALDSSLKPSISPESAASSGSLSVFAASSTGRAYELASAAAQEWKEDAVLLKASATWAQGADRESLLNGSETWSYSFFSPGSKKTANISVNDGQAQTINQGSLGSLIQPSPVEGWTIDSRVAILRMLDEGGEKFINENQIISMTMALTAGAERGRPEWLISILGSRDGRYHNVRIDASNGEVLDAFGSS